MHTPQIFSDLLIIFLASVPVAYLCLRLKLPLIVGLMITGIVIGPYGLGLVADAEGIEMIAEVGVMLLLFSIGLEFSLKRLREMKRLVFIGGGLQVFVTIGVVILLTLFFGRKLNQAIFFGFLAAMSSTAIVLKMYVDRREIDAPHGRAGVGILLFQDISVAFMLLILPVLPAEEAASLQTVLTGLLVSLGALSILVVAAWFILPKFLGQVVKLRSPEVFLLTIVLLCLGMSFATAQLGLSLALGGFIAGVVLADSDYSHQVTAEVLPFRDVFNSVFFVSIGMLLSISVLFANIGFVLLLVIALIAAKALIIWLIIRLIGFPQRIAVMTALGLAQIGEFSFVIAKTGRGFGLMQEGDYQSFLSASIISMIATPFMIAAAPKIGSFIQRILKDKNDPGGDEENAIHETQGGQLQQHVIIVGYGLNGRNLARVLRSVGIPYVILELNPVAVRNAKKQGERIRYGDSTRREVLQHAGIEDAWALVLAISDPDAGQRTVKQARTMSEKLHIIVRTRYVSEITDLLENGADEVIPEEFETSIEIFSRVLHRYGIARNVIESQIEKIRSQGYEMLRSRNLAPGRLDDFNVTLDAASTETIALRTGSPVVGRSLAELNLRTETGATLIAVMRDGETIISPGGDFTLEDGDTIVLLGTPESVEKAKEIVTPDRPFEGFNA